MVEENLKRDSYLVAALSANKKLFIAALFLSAMFVGTVNTLPHIIRENRLEKQGKNYHPYTLTMEYDMVNVIGPRIKEVIEGKLIVRDTDLYENKNGPWIIPPLSPLSFIFFGFVSDSFSNVVVMGDFVFSSLIFLLLFLLFKYLSGKKIWLALIGALFAALYLNFSIDFPPTNLEHLKIIFNTFFPFGDASTASLLTKRESFVPSAIVLLASFVTLFLSIRKPGIKIAITAGIFYALNSYMYPYHFIYVSAVIGVLFVIAIFSRDKNALKNIGIIFLTGLVFLIPFFINQISLRNLPQYNEILERFGIEVGRSFRWLHWKRYLWIIVLSAVTWIWGTLKNKNAEKKFIVSLLLAGIVVLNMQVILGFSVQSDHWLNRDLIWGFAAAYFVIFVWLYEFIKTRKERSLILLALIFLATISVSINSIRYQIKAASDYEKHTLPKNIEEALDWFSNNTPADSVVLSPSFNTNYLIPLHTNSNIFVPRGVNTLASDKEIIERLFIAYKLFGVSENFLSQILSNPTGYKRGSNEFYENSGVSFLFGFKFFSKDLNSYVKNKKSSEPIPPKIKEEIVWSYNRYVCENCIERYRADYIMNGPYEKKISNADFSKDVRFNKVFDKADIQIYKIE